MRTDLPPCSSVSSVVNGFFCLRHFLFAPALRTPRLNTFAVALQQTAELVPSRTQHIHSGAGVFYAADGFGARRYLACSGRGIGKLAGHAFGKKLRHIHRRTLSRFTLRRACNYFVVRRSNNPVRMVLPMQQRVLGPELRVLLFVALPIFGRAQPPLVIWRKILYLLLAHADAKISRMALALGDAARRHN